MAKGLPDKLFGKTITLDPVTGGGGGAPTRMASLGDIGALVKNAASGKNSAGQPVVTRPAVQPPRLNASGLPVPRVTISPLDGISGNGNASSALDQIGSTVLNTAAGLVDRIVPAAADSLIDDWFGGTANAPPPSQGTSIPLWVWLALGVGAFIIFSR